MNKSTCTFPQCSKPVLAKSYCSGHYTQYKTGKTLKPLRSRIPHKADPAAYFWSKVSKPDGENGCWYYDGFTMDNGYVKNGRPVPPLTTRLSHRTAYFLHTGDPAHGQQIDHRCFNVSCCNPHHLRPATQSENNQNRKVGEARKDSHTKVRNVSLITDRNLSKPYCVRLVIEGRPTNLGYFATMKEADAAAQSARREHYPASQW